MKISSFYGRIVYLYELFSLTCSWLVLSNNVFVLLLILCKHPAYCETTDLVIISTLVLPLQ